ncbi:MULTISPECIES: hypothetical protein [Mesorhizobium]|uniref:hypothetical protein n=1 Tax=Mesorhizobium TaxID=68287 RepID=UPI0003CE2B2B|nr:MULTISPECIES: hypothetical protein [Mesorhizobium]ESY61408.1 hypothetical protein X742_34070 [Mesorhizobium sp. LNHC232B00]WJI37364.1 hypothetical protein NL534_26345 [Mesorhizobium opportunistum]
MLAALLASFPLPPPVEIRASSNIFAVIAPFSARRSGGWRRAEIRRHRNSGNQPARAPGGASWNGLRC